jgi:putative transposase
MYFTRAAGVARKAYNWGLFEWQRQYEAGKKPNWISVNRELNAIKRDEFPYMLEVTKAAPQYAIRNLGRAYDAFFRRLKNGDKKVGYPRPHKKGLHDSFVATNGPGDSGSDAARIVDKRITLPRTGSVRMAERLRFSGRVLQVTISRTADKWYAAIRVDTEAITKERNNHGSVGVDLGVTRMAVLSDGTEYDAPSPLKKLKRKERRLNKDLARTKRYRSEDGRRRDSENRKKAKLRLARLHQKIRNIRQDAIHKATTEIVLNNKVVVLEDLNVAGMRSSHRIARGMDDVSMGEFRRQLQYKAGWYGTEVILADRFFPSSKTCAKCGTVKNDLRRDQRVFRCDHCGHTENRDINAAINLRKLAVSSTESQNACGEDGAGTALVV